MFCENSRENKGRESMGKLGEENLGNEGREITEVSKREVRGSDKG